jgi:predicted dehydrogenase
MKRRSFLKSSVAIAAAGVTIVPRHVLGGPEHTAPSEKLRLASIGIGGMGGTDLGNLAGGPVELVAMCDVNSHTLGSQGSHYKCKNLYADWRKLLDEQDSKIDAVNVATPDHMHAPITMSAIHRGKNVYCQKPLTHSIYEARQVALAAEKAKVATQMGIQIHSSIEYRMAVEILQAGVLGKIKEVHAWSDRPSWPQGHPRSSKSDKVPANLNWDLWLGVAPERPYIDGAYSPFNWRGVCDFGCGALGDMGCHIIDTPYTALKLTSPKSILVEGPGCTDDEHPSWEIIHYDFPGTQFTAGSTLPLVWYDGGHKPSEDLVPLDSGNHLGSNGSILIGEEGSMYLPHVGGPQLLPKEKFAGYKRPKLKGRSHWEQWIDACLGKGKTSAGFDFAGPLTETVLLGTLSAHFPGKKLEWNSAELKFNNSPEASALVHNKYRAGWEVDGLGV